MTDMQFELRIRDAVLDDAEALVGLLNPIIEAGTTALDTMLTVADEREYIKALPERAIFLVAVQALRGRLVGCQSVEPFTTGTHAFDHVGVMGTYVDVAYQRQGIGRRLFEATFKRAHRTGYEKIFTYVRQTMRRVWRRTSGRDSGWLGRRNATRRSKGDTSTRCSSSGFCQTDGAGLRARRAQQRPPNLVVRRLATA